MVALAWVEELGDGDEWWGGAGYGGPAADGAAADGAGEAQGRALRLVPRAGGRVSARQARTFLWRRTLVVGALALVAALAWGATARLVPAAGAAPSATHTYVARPGDTIWAIAVRFSTGGDPWPLVDRLEAQIGGGTLQPGQVLTVP
jgi:nucleoid-associated protein YgaU